MSTLVVGFVLYLVKVLVVQGNTHGGKVMSLVWWDVPVGDQLNSGIERTST